VLRALVHAGARVVVIGGVAVQMHGSARASARELRDREAADAAESPH